MHVLSAHVIAELEIPKNAKKQIHRLQNPESNKKQIPQTPKKQIPRLPKHPKRKKVKDGVARKRHRENPVFQGAPRASSPRDRRNPFFQASLQV